MKKTNKLRLFSLLLAGCVMLGLFAFPATAASRSATNTADALNELGLFYGTGESYDLDSGLTRAQGIALLIRIIGKENEARTNKYVTPFKDVPSWAAGYIGYAYTHKITAGVSETEFNADGPMTDNMFLTLTLRALGYSDTGSNPLYNWENPYAIAKELGLVSSAVRNNNFRRSDAVEIFWNAFDVKLYDETITLAQRLINQGVFTSEQLDAARQTQKNGRQTGSGVPMAPADPPVVAEKPVEPPKPDVPAAADPVKPSDPSNPSAPSDPTVPEDPAKPDEPTKPDDPTPPTPPTPPVDPELPSDPIDDGGGNDIIDDGFLD